STATPSTATFIAIHATTDPGTDASALLRTLTTGDGIYVQDQGNAANFVRYDLTGPAVNNTTWFRLPVAIHGSSSGGSLPSNNTPLLAHSPPSGAGGAGAGMDIPGLTASDPDYPDEVAIYDISATGNRKVTVGKIGGLLHTAPGGRLSLTTNPTDDADALLTNVYYVPYLHNRINLWDGTRWVALTFSTYT